MASEESEIAYVRDHWDNQAKGTNYLLAGHGALLVGYLTVLKDANASSALKGLSIIGAISAAGLLLAALAYAAILVVRSTKIKNLRGRSTKVDDTLLVGGFKFFQVGSFVLFLLSMIVLAWKLLMT